jgi:hypothetical protein
MSLSFAAEVEGLAGWVEPNPPKDILNFVIGTITGSGTYATNGQNIDLSTWLDVLYGAAGMGCPLKSVGGKYYAPSLTNIVSPANATIILLDGATEAANGANIANATWRMMFWGTKNFPA